MSKVRFVFTLLLSAMLIGLIPGAALAANPEPQPYKQLAGSAEEILSGAMALPNPAENGIRSRAAMLPVTLTQAKGGAWTWEAQIPVDGRAEVAFVLLTPPGKSWKMNVSAPGLNGEQTAAAMESGTSDFGMEGNTYPAQVYRFAEASAGLWNIRIEGAESGSGYLIASSDSAYRLHTYLNTYELYTGKSIGLQSYLYDARTDGAAAPLQVTVSAVSARIFTPQGTVETLGGAPTAEGASTLGFAFIPQSAGLYTAQVEVRGTTPEGLPFVRTSELVFPVVQNSAVLGSRALAQKTADAWRWNINLPVSGVEVGKTLLGYAEVWGTDLKGNPAPVAWVSGLADVTSAGLPLGFDLHWVGYSGARPPFVLRNVRLQDPDTHIPLATAETVALTTPRLTRAALETVAEISPAMQMGARPTAAPAPEATGGKLMLVHGYCSNNAWPTANFTNYIVFQDYNQNRTHDQFAQLIKNFGAAYPSFGVVAHSQGGAATLHLYTYYWSGLDYATGGTRLIQSVGTPYQGTALAGNLALLGQIFGVGCGSNWDLSYDGAALWLASVPSWARAKVNYWTTSDTEVWWRWDYCNMATDPILNDPEDGVVEKAYAQLSGATNRGHKEGWCHTSGMRDPGQTSDSGRNTEMNANASR